MRHAKTALRTALTTVLVAILALGAIGSADAAPKANWFAAWGFSQQGVAPETLTDATIRMITRPTLSGSAVRVTIENTFGAQPLTIGAAYVGQSIHAFTPWAIPGLSSIPWLGQIFFDHDPLTYLSFLAGPAVWYLLYRSRWGLIDAAG